VDRKLVTTGNPETGHRELATGNWQPGPGTRTFKLSKVVANLISCFYIYNLIKLVVVMKRLRTVNGVKYIQYLNRSDFEDKVQEAVTEHRATLIGRLLNGLNEYVEYKFNLRVAPEQAEKIKEKLMTLKHQAVAIEDCTPIVEQLLKKDICVLSSSDYYKQIDERIKYGLD